MSLFYRETGRGEPVILLHGLYGCSDNWMTIARKLSECYRVICVDLRNHGNSPHYSSHRYLDMASDLSDLLNDVAIDKAHLLGHSMGGKVAMAFASIYPKKVLSLAVADIAPKNYLNDGNDTSGVAMHKRLLNTLSSVDLTHFHQRKEVEDEMGKTIEDEFVISFIMKNLRRGTTGFEWKINVPVLKEYLTEILGGIDYSFFEDSIPILHYPVFFIKGGLSNYIKEEDLLLIRRIFPEAKFKVIEGTTHYLHVEKPDELIDNYLNFLKGNKAMM
jgi:esterase